jgi:hypothetical protein
LHLGQHYYNVADLFIIAATPVFIVSLSVMAIARAVRLAAATARRRPAQTRAQARMQAVAPPRSISARGRLVAASAAVGAVAVTAIGAINSGTVTAAATLASSR